MTGIPAMALAPAAAAVHIHAVMLVMPHPRYGQDPRGDGNDAKTQQHHHRGQQPPQR